MKAQLKHHFHPGNQQKILVKHVRSADPNNLDSAGKPLATIVAIDKDHIGVAYCSNRRFNNNDGMLVAFNRAVSRSDIPKPPRVDVLIKRKVHDENGSRFVAFRGTLADLMAYELMDMQDRANRYFKEEEVEA